MFNAYWCFKRKIGSRWYHFIFTKKSLSFCWLIIVLFFFFFFSSAVTTEEKIEFLSESLSSLLLAQELDPSDSTIPYFISLHLADLRDIPSALQFIRKSLELSPSSSDSWFLLVLLLSASKTSDENALIKAKEAATIGLKFVSQNVNLKMAKGRIENALGDSASALKTFSDAFLDYKRMSQSMSSQKIDDAESIHSIPASIFLGDDLNENMKSGLKENNKY